MVAVESDLTECSSRENDHYVSSCPIERFMGKRAADRASQKIKAVFGPSTRELLERSQDRSASCATFAPKEIVKGDQIGVGGFSCVYEIEAFELRTQRRLEGGSATRQAARKHLAETARAVTPFDAFLGQEYGSMATYAIKYLKPSLTKNPVSFVSAASDLAVEARLMLGLDHPNILKICGLPSSGLNGFQDGPDGYFLIVDKLNMTLDQKLIQWRIQLEKYEKMNNFLFRCKKERKLKKLYQRRLRVAYELASALEYLHGQNIIFRDFKSANIGLDMDDKAKLFDFGLARPLERDWDFQAEPLRRGGSLHYMAPEVDKSEPYNLKADVWSFGVVLWEILQCRCCLDRDGDGPLPISPLWPKALQDLVSRSLSHDMNKRPSMKEIRLILRQQLTELQHIDDTAPSLTYSSSSEDSSA